MDFLRQMNKFIKKFVEKFFLISATIARAKRIKDQDWLRIFQITLACFSLFTVTICNQEMSSRSQLLITDGNKYSKKVANFMHLKKNLLVNDFDTQSIAKLIQNLAQVIGWEWYDQNAKIELNFIFHDGKKFVTKAQFQGMGKVIKLDYESAFENDMKNIENKQEFLVLKGYVSKTLDSMILNAQEVPFLLRKNILKFVKEANLYGTNGDRFYCLYHPKDFKISAVILQNGGNKRQAILYKSSMGLKIFNQNGVALRGERLVFHKPVYGRLSSHYGYRLHPVLKIYRFHWGVDYAAPRGTPIHAAAAGQVIFAGIHGGYGNCIRIKHGHITTLYAHLQYIPKFIYVGKQVAAREKIGYVGSTGLATGPHLHYEIWVNGQKINPLKFNQEVHKKLKDHEYKAFKIYQKRLMEYFYN